MESIGVNQLRAQTTAFKKLKRRISALERQGTPVDEAEKLKLRNLDAWLCQNDRTWHTNFPAKPISPTIPSDPSLLSTPRTLPNHD